MPVERPVPMEWGSIRKDSRADMDVDLSASDSRTKQAVARASRESGKKKPKQCLGLIKGLGVNPRTRRHRLDIRSRVFQRNSFLCVDP